MQKVKLYLALLLLEIIITGIGITGTGLQATEPQWIFNNGPDCAKVTVGQGDVTMETNLFLIKPTGGDMTLQVPFEKENAFSADHYRYFAIRYKMKTGQKFGGLFFTTDTLTTLSDKSYSQFPINGNNSWHNSVIDMNSFRHEQWKGKITSFRLDPTNPSDSNSEIMISRIGFFPTKEAAFAFLDKANDRPDYSRETVFNGERQRCFVPGGSLFDGYKKSQFLIRDLKIRELANLRGQEPERIVVQFKDEKEIIQNVPCCRTNREGFTAYLATKPGRYFLTADKKSEGLTDLTDLDQSDRFAELAKNRMAGGQSKNDLSNQIARAIRFVIARNLMTAPDKKFRPFEKLSEEQRKEIGKAIQNSGLTTKEFNSEKILTPKMTRAEAAVLISKAVDKRLGTGLDSKYSADWFTRDRIRIGAWANIRARDFNEDYIKTYHDCGFDWLIAMPSVSGSAHRGGLFQWCNRYGIEVFIHDGGFTDPANRTAEYCDQPSFAGHYITDEPGSDQFDKLAAICNAYKKATGGKTPYVNLLPMYANAAQFKFGAGAAAIEYYDSDPNLFKKYCDLFCEKFNTNYICTDIYPLNWTKDGKKLTYKDYVESINIIATSAREHQRDFWCFIQTFAWIKSKRTPNESEFRWQCYSMLSFGCKGILCWTYAGAHPEYPSLVDYDSKKTQAWYDAQKVFQEIKLISDDFVKYKNIGAMTHLYSKEVPYLRMSNPCKNFKTIQKIECPDPLLIGCFEKIDGSGSAFTLVNMSELQENKKTTALLKINGAKVVSRQRGLTKELKAENGYYQIKLDSGEGCFITVD